MIEVQNSILKMVAQGDDLDATLSKLCCELEILLPGTRASILTLDTNGLLHPLVAPSLPRDYSAALDGIAIGPAAGSCGTAAYLRRVVVVDDIESDPRWSASKHLAQAAGLKACFSSPIFGSRGQVLATFALYFEEPRGPTAFEQSVVEGCLPLCMIAFERYGRVLERERLAYTDALTGLTNRAKFNKDLETAPVSGWSLLLIDIDNLKNVNDTFGHAAGDDLIAVVAARIAGAAGVSRAYRIGGDEFAVILDDATAIDPAELAELIGQNVSIPASCGEHTAFPTITIGIAHAATGLSVAEVRQNADIALYHAKEENRGGVLIYDAALTTAISRRSEAIHKVATALKEDRIEAWYQPIVRIDTGEIVGVEALARMRTVDGAIVPASEFFEATKDAQVAAALTRRMIECIARDVGAWLRLGIPFQHVGINLSAADFSCTDLPESLEIAFKREGVPLHHAILEVTESVYLGDRDRRVAKKIASLRAAGLRIALDDFGTGFASLTHLITVPVDIIKIDKSFTALLSPDDPGTGVVEGILHIAKRLGIKVVVEGIETLEQAELLLERGCVLGQGYLYWKALPADQICALLRERGQGRDSVSELNEALVRLSGHPGSLLQRGMT
ncbi:GGDEF and EAL domain-containing protein [Neorhizobium lilium]|uniref:GGDEF and EAL domain-containing protein n=1 Tax=Neorhizobium lilium TaxID=2503024 RepID=A0A444LBG0_9HYPH|nr:GGDEF and EAL domain-containing protein [Neorhizobium lilium]